jgi:hypothetical protein
LGRKIRGYPDKRLYNLLESPLVLEKPRITLTSSFTRFTRFFSSELPSAAVKNTSGFSVPGLTAVGPDERKSVEGLVDKRSASKSVDKSYIISVVENKPVEEGETLGN